MTSDVERELQTALNWLQTPCNQEFPVYLNSLTPTCADLLTVCNTLCVEDIARFISFHSDTKEYDGILSLLLFGIAKQSIADMNFSRAQDALLHPLSRKIDTSDLRLALIGHTYHTLAADKVFEILSPAKDRLFESIDSFILHLSWLVCAAFAAGELGVALSVARAIGSAKDRDPPATPPAQAIIRRLIKLASWSGLPETQDVHPDDWDRLSSDCLLRLDEWSMLQGLSQLSLLSSATTESAVRRIALLAAIARTERWAMAYQSVLDLAAGAIAAGMMESDLFNALSCLGLPGNILAYAGRRARSSADNTDPMSGLPIFDDAPSLSAAKRIWDGLARSGNAAAVVRYATLDDLEAELARLAISTSDAAIDTVPIWLFMTWRDNVPRLVSNIANLQSRKGRIIVSVGGSGHPAGLGYASAAMLVPRVFFLNRAPLTWGGPKLLFQTVLEIMALFRTMAPAGSWMQVICDRTVALRPMDEIAHVAAKPKNLAKLSLYQGVMPAWYGELRPEQVEQLPQLLGRSIDSVFASIDTEELQELAGPFSFHHGMHSDHRLDSFSFNFAATPRSVQTSSNSEDQVYAVSAFDADTRWMSFARLHEFVDVSPEAAVTYSRRMPLVTQAWVHRTLKDYKLRNGSPFVFFSRAYAEALLDMEEFPAIFAAMNMGFGPEMNYFDSIAATLDIGENFLHSYATVDGGAFEDRHIGSVSYSVDAEDYMFARKSESRDGKKVLQYFSDRKLLAGDWRETHWVAAFAPSPYSSDFLPTIDDQLMGNLVDRDFICRDMLGRTRMTTQMRSDGTVHSEGSEIDGRWSFAHRVLTVDFGRRNYGIKRYVSMAASAERLVLAPEELVGRFNGWSLFLDFSLGDIQNSSQQMAIGEGLSNLSPCRWYGGSDLDTCVLAPFSRGDGELPIPVLAEDGDIIEFRLAGALWLALVRIAGIPSLLRLRGAAYASGQTLYTFTKAGEDSVSSWDLALPGRPCFVMSVEQMSGQWRLETVEGERQLTFETNGAVRDTGTAVGRWVLRTDGIQLFGIEGLRVGLASQYRVHDGSWRLSGWGYEMIGKKVSFALSQVT